MGFEGLLGNDRLKDNLKVSAARGRLSHFYLICGPEGSGKHTLAQLLAAAEKEHFTRISKGDCKPEVGILFLELVEEMRKISRHLEISTTVPRCFTASSPMLMNATDY